MRVTPLRGLLSAPLLQCRECARLCRRSAVTPGGNVCPWCGERALSTAVLGSPLRSSS
ncbi:MULTISPECIES: hypothetical protein [Rhodococcus]|uniref:hypothetical protein n=1 Tax=Rhodococcus TaxID=1827 RepID=UPI000A8ED22F|nr:MULTISPECIES: hypothetical protein [Rhodococcus]MBT9299260.1 hypothetical protein [Rhodococcus sp. GOMB7]MCD2108529.1 hypothetical protein [Rhodococcus qingshengii]MCQ4151979.1 hypothetical protein [Rhodococcus qingshengii]MCZ4527420.1 hypothetical protein [Rhodococcus erythropolis]MDJ0490944.1 hypothetical protein [Rhodococcus qingshengii]